MEHEIEYYIRKEALDQAIQVSENCTADEIVENAELFLAFLKGDFDTLN